MDDIQTMQVASRRIGAKFFVPEGEEIIDLCRKGIELEIAGQSYSSVAKEIGLAEHTYRVVRQIVFLNYHIDLNETDTSIISQACKIIAESRKYSRAWEIAEPVAAKVWGTSRKAARITDIAERRVEKFERAFGIVMQSCMSTDELELPYLSTEQVKKFNKEIDLARKALSAFATRIEEIQS